MKSDTAIKIGIIGAGRIGKLHAENVASRIRHATLAAISDIILPVAQKAADELDIPNASEDYREILDDKSMQAVLICSSTDTHAQIIQEAAEAGKHIFCEKPIDLDLHRLKQVLKSVEQAGVKFQVGFNRRFDTNFSRLRKLLSEGQVGTPHILRITSRDPAPPPLEYVKISGGIFLDMTIHDFDMARFLMDSEVEEVFAMGDARIDPEIKKVNDIDTAIVNLKFENGAIGTIDNSRQAIYGYDQRIEVFGSKGMLQANNMTPDNVVLMNEEAVRSTKPHYFFVERYRESYAAEIQAFVEAILNDTEPPVTGIDGMMPLKIGLAAKKSFAENKPIKVSEIDWDGIEMTHTLR